MPTQPLPAVPSLEYLRKHAKRLRNAVRAGNPESLLVVREYHPRADEALADFLLSDAQLVVARFYRFASWPALKAHLKVVERYAWDPPSRAEQQPGADSSLDTFLRLACLNYGDWDGSRAEKARLMLAEHPEFSTADIYAASAIGDVAAARDLLAHDLELVNARGGALRWEPLLYACYSRLDSPNPEHSTLEVARLLLSMGADPNAGFLWRGNVPPFTALTGAFGEGEDGSNQPPHKHCEALARLLLEAGADPNDEQTLYNRHFNPNDDHLKLLFSCGLGQDKGGPWFKRLGEQLHRPGQMLVEELWSAAAKNRMERVKLLVEHGAEVNARGFRDGRTPYEAAMLAGNREIAAYLLLHGARETELSPDEYFAAACVAGNRADALALLAGDSGLVEKLGKVGRAELMHKAVEANRTEGIRLMAELGFELDGTVPDTGMDRSPMHDAAWRGDLELVKLFIELGADPNVREPSYNATPLGWAAHNNQTHVVDYLISFATIFDAVEQDCVERVAELLQQDPSLARAIDEKGEPLVFHLHDGLKRADELIVLLRAHGADLNQQDGKGRTLLDVNLARGDVDFANVLRGHGAKTAQELEAAL